MDPKKTKILYLITKSVWGGAQRYVFDLATNLPPNFEPIVITGGRGPLTKNLENKKIKVLYLPILQQGSGFWKIITLRHFVTLWQIFKIYRKENPNIIHLNSSVLAGIGALAGFFYKLPKQKNLRPKVIFTVHGWPFNEDRPYWQKKNIYWGSRLTAFFCDKIITISTSDFEAGKKFLPPNKLSLIFLGIQETKILEKAENLKSNILTIGTIAEFTPNKGIEYLLRAAKLISVNQPWRLVIVGWGEEEKKMLSLVKKLGLQNVFFTGFISEADRYLSHIAALDIFALPSKKEGMPYVVMDAMSAGVPVVATKVGGLPDLIDNGVEGLLVQPKNPRDLAQALDKLIEDKVKREKFGEAAFHKIKENFTLSEMLNKTLKLYED